MKNLIQLVFFFATFIALTSEAIATTPQQICQARKNRTVARYISCSFRAESRTSNPTSLRNCQLDFEQRWKTIVSNTTRQHTTCFDAPLKNRTYRTYIRSRTNDITTLLGKGVKHLRLAQRKCRARKTFEAGNYAACRQRAEGNLARTEDSGAYAQLITQCESSFQSKWQDIIDAATASGTTCFDNSRTISDYKSRLDTQTTKVAGILAGTDLFNPISITVSGSPLSLDAGGATGSLTITNTSTKGVASAIAADFSNTALQGLVTVIANTCSSLSPGGSCTLTLETEDTVIPMTAFTIKGTNTTLVNAVLTITAPPAVISLTGSPLQLSTGGGSGVIAITNSSTISTASNIRADFTGTALDGNVTETGNTCSSVAPGTGCTITFTSGNVDVAQTDFTILGDNTNSLSAAISIVTPPPTIATLSVTGSPLQLTTNGPTGDLTITNTSVSVTALNITSDFTGTALDGNVTETGNTCASLPPSSSCTLTYTPGSTVVSETDFIIQGTNTTAVTSSIQIDAGITIDSVSTNSGPVSGGSGVTLTGSGFTGATDVTFGGIAATSVNVVSSTTVTAVTPAHSSGAVDVVITTPAGSATSTNGFTYLATTVGQSAYGGIIGCLNGGLNDLIAATADNSTGIIWGGFAIATGATSVTNGAANTVTIVSAIGAGPYAAQICDSYEVDSQGNTPCEAGNTCYNDWFLPAGNNTSASGQLNCLYTNGNAIGGFASAIYRSSTESSATNAWVQNFSNGSQATGTKNSALRVRCVRAFTP